LLIGRAKHAAGDAVTVASPRPADRAAHGDVDTLGTNAKPGPTSTSTTIGGVGDGNGGGVGRGCGVTRGFGVGVGGECAVVEPAERLNVPIPSIVLRSRSTCVLANGVRGADCA